MIKNQNHDSWLIIFIASTKNVILPVKLHAVWTCLALISWNLLRMLHINNTYSGCQIQPIFWTTKPDSDKMTILACSSNLDFDHLVRAGFGASKFDKVGYCCYTMKYFANIVRGETRGVNNFIHQSALSLLFRRRQLDRYLNIQKTYLNLKSYWQTLLHRQLFLFSIEVPVLQRK